MGFIGHLKGENAIIKNLVLSEASVEPEAANHAGILVGYVSSGKVEQCGALNCRVSGADFNGGLVGHNGGTISRCFSRDGITGAAEDRISGGLVGRNTGTVTNCYAIGEVAANEYSGGMVGRQDEARLSKCYASGTFDGVGQVGGLIGYLEDDSETSDHSNDLIEERFHGTISASYWKQIRGMVNTCGNQQERDCCAICKKSHSEMILQSTYWGWDFLETWTFDEAEDYPRLMWE